MKPIGDPGNATVGDVLRWSLDYIESLSREERRPMWDMRSGMRTLMHYTNCTEAARVSDFLGAIPSAEEQQRAERVKSVTLYARTARARGLIRQYLKHQPRTTKAPVVALMQKAEQAQRSAPALLEAARLVRLLPEFPLLAPRLAQLLADVLREEGNR